MDVPSFWTDHVSRFVVSRGRQTVLGTKAKVNQARCAHSLTLSITAAGVERTVCETCGNVSFKFDDTKPAADVQREMFARDVDTRMPELVGAA